MLSTLWSQTLSQKETRRKRGIAELCSSFRSASKRSPADSLTVVTLASCRKQGLLSGTPGSRSLSRPSSCWTQQPVEWHVEAPSLCSSTFSFVTRSSRAAVAAGAPKLRSPTSNHALAFCACLPSLFRSGADPPKGLFLTVNIDLYRWGRIGFCPFEHRYEPDSPPGCVVGCVVCNSHPQYLQAGANSPQYCCCFMCGWYYSQIRSLLFVL